MRFAVQRVVLPDPSKPKFYSKKSGKPDLGKWTRDMTAPASRPGDILSGKVLGHLAAASSRAARIGHPSLAIDIIRLLVVARSLSPQRMASVLTVTCSTVMTPFSSLTIC